MTLHLQNLIGGERRTPSGAEVFTRTDPADGETVVFTHAASSPADADAAVADAAAAFRDWKRVPAVKRCRILFQVKGLLERHREELAKLTVRENGKLLPEAEASVRRGLEVVEFACGLPHLGKGERLEDIAANVDGYTCHEPLGVAAGACPFNFPAMVPMWMVPIAIACGNAFVLKPSDKCPATALRIAELFLEGGLPPGVFNVVLGGREAFERLIVHPEVRAVSFVGSTAAARNVWGLATGSHKRVQALGGAKNHIIVMPDAEPAGTLDAILSSAYGCAGERCMASSVLILVGSASGLLPRIIESARGIRLGDGMDPASQMGPLVTLDHKQRVEAAVERAVRKGATLLLDGRGAKVPGREAGYYVGPTILGDVSPEMEVAREEIFGPVLCVMRAGDLDGAIRAANQSPYGNGASIFTRSGGAARKFRAEIECGMLGINAGVPAPMAFFGFGGHKESLFGDLRVQGPDGVAFYTQKKSVIERWIDAEPTGSIWGT